MMKAINPARAEVIIRIMKFLTPSATDVSNANMNVATAAKNSTVLGLKPSMSVPEYRVVRQNARDGTRDDEERVDNYLHVNLPLPSDLWCRNYLDHQARIATCRCCRL
jgi:hypothetical protein